MASEQLSRRENITTERKIQNAEDSVPQRTTHFELRETHELGPNFQSLPRNENQAYLDRGARAPLSANVSESYLDRARVPLNANIPEHRVREKEDFGGVRDMGKFQMESKGGNKSLAEDRETLDTRSRMVTGTPHIKEASGKGQVVEERERARERAMEEEEKRLTMEEISKYRNQAQQSALEALSAAQEKYERAKQATNETLRNTTQAAQEKGEAAQAKDATFEKTQQGYEMTGDTVSNSARTASEKAAQAKNTTLGKTQQGYEATRDTVSNAARTAAEYATPAAEKARCVAVQAKDVTLETGKTAAEKAKCAAEIAAKVAVDLKEKATVAGWTASHYATQLTVDGTRAAANAVEGAVGYVAPKASELAAKSVETVKGLAASAGETAKEFTARKKEESWREYEAKRASQLQEGEEILPSTGGIGKVLPSGERTQAQGTNLQEKVQGKGSDILGAVTETVSDIGSSMIKPIDNANTKVKEHGGTTITPKGQDAGGVLDAIGETIAEIAHTTKVIVVGEDDEVEKSMQKNIGSDSHSLDRAKHEGYRAPKNNVS
uniref:Seed biotin-containing protein SBP65 n=1 Tax=Pisum sativum TaxID=3888 RepID=SBP65_PEA|nr:RecName: Full=Seed biotin-containing protein SBP65; AltName: Full=Seed biotinylated protein of 65 kDa [Pisum sativum]AAC49857.1 SBP65 [Pisum sativum]CAA53474.1 sbp65a [Pisum sativum]